MNMTISNFGAKYKPVEKVKHHPVVRHDKGCNLTITKPGESNSSVSFKAYYTPAFKGFFDFLKGDGPQVERMIKFIDKGVKENKVENLKVIDKTNKNHEVETTFKIRNIIIKLEEIETAELGHLGVPSVLNGTSYSLTIQKANGEEKMLSVTAKQWNQLMKILEPLK